MLHYRRKFTVRTKCIQVHTNIKEAISISRWKFLCLFPILYFGQIVFTFQMRCSRILFGFLPLASGMFKQMTITSILDACWSRAGHSSN